MPKPPDNLALYPVDLQVHSTASDGTDEPAALVERAARLGIQVLSLTDHDSVLGVEEALAAGRAAGVQIVPALEFSTMMEPDRDFIDINILAYGIDHRAEELLKTLQKILDNRVEQKVRQIQKLQAYGIDVPVDEVLAAADGVPGRVHIARVALARNPQHFTSIDDVFRLYLDSNAPNSTLVMREFSLRVEDAIEIAHHHHGRAVLAHPGVYTRVRDIDAVVRRLADAGLDGLEVHYTYAQNRGHKGADAAHVAAVIAHFDRLADSYGLQKTGGSDYHGTTKPGIEPGQAGLTHSQWNRLRRSWAL